MVAYVKRFIGLVILVLTLLLVVFVINQTVQMYYHASTISPAFGKFVLYILLAFYAVILIAPLVWIGKTPGVLLPPEDTDGEEYQNYIRKLCRRLSENPHTGDIIVKPDDLSSVEEALRVLDGKADERIKAGASGIFVMTAISQYGALDGLIVLLAQFRMIWQVMMIYNQRPSFKVITYLYSNVFAATFLATRLENLKYWRTNWNL